MSLLKHSPTGSTLWAWMLRHRHPFALVLVLLALLLSAPVFAGYQSTAAAQTRFHASDGSTLVVKDGTNNEAVVTYKNDLARTGQDTHESKLTTRTVNARSFGKHMSYPVDGRVYAQPLYVPHLRIGGALHNMVFVATEHDSVYAFDADRIVNATPLWQTSFISPPGVVPISVNDILKCPNFGGSDIGITGTPIIDLKTNTLFVVAATKEHGHFFSRLHALDILTGQEEPHSPVTITATFPGKGAGKKTLQFNAQAENQRVGLLLLNSVVYIAWGSYCDIPPYYGWLMGYHEGTLRRTSVWVPTPDAIEGGIWQSGAGLAADSQGNIYLESGDGDFNLDTGGHEAGDSVLKLSPQHGLHVVDYFTPFNEMCMHWFNLDLGSAGPLLLPDASEVLATGKEGRIYVLNRNQLGGYNTVVGPCSQLARTDVDQVVQELPPNTAAGGVFGSLAYWHGPGRDYVYVSGFEDTHLKAFRITGGLLSQTPSSESPGVVGPHGHPLVMTGNPAVSCNGQKPGTAIVWLIDQRGILRAFDAADLSHELYNSTQVAKRDSLRGAIKFSVPTVANGKVFVGTTNSLIIYGAL